MSDIYVECLVEKKQSTLAKLALGAMIGIAVLLFLLMLVMPLVFILFLASLAGIWAIRTYTNVEFEYLYIDRELVIDKVLAKTRRKRVGTYSMDRVEIMAPIHSYHLDNYKHRETKDKDYSIGEELKPDRRYALYYEGGEKLILSPSEDLVKAMRSIAPRKIFTD